MCCEQPKNTGCVVQGQGEEGCHGDESFNPAFWTKAEKIAQIEECLLDLRKRVSLFEERLAKLKKEN